MTQEKQFSELESDRTAKVHETESGINTLSETECDRKAMLFWCGAGKPEGQYPTYRKAVEKWAQAESNEGAFDIHLKRLREIERRSKQLDIEATRYWQADDRPDGEYEFYREAIEEYRATSTFNNNDFKIFLRRKRAHKYTLYRKILFYIFLILLTLLGLLIVYLLMTPGSQFADFSAFFLLLASSCICIFCFMRPVWPRSFLVLADFVERPEGHCL